MLTSTPLFFVAVFSAILMTLYILRLNLRLRRMEKRLQQLATAQAAQANPAAGRGLAVAALVLLFVLWVAVMRAGM